MATPPFLRPAASNLNSARQTTFSAADVRVLLHRGTNVSLRRLPFWVRFYDVDRSVRDTDMTLLRVLNHRRHHSRWQIRTCAKSDIFCPLKCATNQHLSSLEASRVGAS